MSSRGPVGPRFATDRAGVRGTSIGQYEVQEYLRYSTGTGGYSTSYHRHVRPVAESKVWHGNIAHNNNNALLISWHSRPGSSALEA